MSRHLFVPTTSFAVVCAAAMWAWPGEETIPYHLGYAAFAVAYGLDPWPRARAFGALAGYTLATGGVLVSRAATGVVEWGETAEVPLMAALMALMMWHVLHRHAALAEVTRMAAADRERARGRELLARLTSHEMRTPLTIASGYVDLLLGDEPDPLRRADLDVVRDELGRLSRAGDRLLRMIRFQEALPSTWVDLDEVLRDTARRWAAVAERDWQVDTTAGLLRCSPERLRAALDTLIENAVRYTRPGDTIRLFGRRAESELRVGVADAGPGFSPALAAAVSAPPGSIRDPLTSADDDPRSQTGLGLELVRQIVRARGGRVVAARAAEGGAEVSLVLPTAPDGWSDHAATPGSPLADRPGMSGVPEAWVRE